MSDRPIFYPDVESCVEATIETIGRKIRLGTPLGLGKANHLINEFFRRAREDPRIDLRIFTALTLARPRWENDLGRRLLEPLVERLFEGYPELEYVDPLRHGTLPDNIRVSEFYFQPGSFLHSPLAQQNYVSSNYTHVVRDVLDAGINVLAQLVGKSDTDGAIRYSLSCNSDLTLDLVPRMRELAGRGQKMAVLAQANRNLPFMYGDADVGPDYFDGIVDDPRYDFPLFAAPNRSVETAEYMIALHVSALIRDGGTLQIGIGSLGDALTYLLKLRHVENSIYLSLLRDSGILDRFSDVLGRLGGTTPFREGLYAATEMLVDGFLELYRSGILKRKVYPGGAVAHACFFLGPRRFYDALNQMDRAEREQFHMTRISFVNQLYGDEELKRAQRKNARFVNSGLIATLSGAVASDMLEDGRVVSGVGGQYNFVAMAHALEDGRSILMIPSTREAGGKVHSNVLWSYGSTTIPHQLRDLVVTEYGIADLRGRTDEEVATALLEIADSRFQEGLVAEAKRAGKIARRYRIPDACRRNTPERLDGVLAPLRERGMFEQFPFGTDFTPEEVVLGKALTALKERGLRNVLPRPRDLGRTFAIPEKAHPYLQRMRLDAPRTVKERLLQRVVVYALAAVDAI
jgi:acyl-CoA hydrolase